MKNNRCGIVRDLIPLYIDGVCSEESTEMVRNHIENCKECRDIYESMKDESIEASVYNETEKVIGRHRQKERQERKREYDAEYNDKYFEKWT